MPLLTSMFRVRSLSRVAACIVVMGFGSARAVERDTARFDHAPKALSTAVNDALHLRDSRIADLTPVETADGFVTISVPLNGQWSEIVLWPYSMRAADFRVRADVGDGVLEDVSVAPPRTYRGTVDGVGSVSAVVEDDGLWASIELPDYSASGSSWWFVEPIRSLSIPGVADDSSRRAHVIYESEDLLPMTGGCATEDHGDAPMGYGRRVPKAGREDAEPSPAGGVRLAQVAFDADVEYFNLLGGSIQAVVDDIELVMLGVEHVYDRQVGLLYEITEIIVRTEEPDPYTSNNPSVLLAQFRLTWNNTPLSETPRDMTHLFTGRILEDDVLGIAAVGQACIVSSAYGLSRSRFSASFARRVDLTTHELGHNWNALHCDVGGGTGFPYPGCCTLPSYTMCSFIGSTVRQEFCPPNLNRIESFLNISGCLSDPPVTIVPPFFDDFSDTEFDPDEWVTVGATVDDVGADEPSPPTSLRLNGDDWIKTGVMDTSAICELALEYWWQRSGTLGTDGSPEPGEDLLVEYRDRSGDWVLAAQHPGAGPDDEPYAFERVELGDDARHGAFQVRFRINDASFNDNFFIDDVRIAGIANGVTITSQPQSTVGCVGDTVAFNVDAEGDPPLLYQWSHNQEDIPGATDDTLTIESVGEADYGEYRVRISNACGSVESSRTALDEADPIDILHQPDGATVPLGQTFLTWVSATGVSTFQWYKDGEPMPGFTTATLVLTNVDCDDGGAYHCVMANDCHTVATQAAQLVVEHPDCADTVAPFIVHASGLSGETRPFSGYIDPRFESSNGVDLNQGIREVKIIFSEPVADLGAENGELTPAAFVLEQTGGGAPPQVVSVDPEQMPLVSLRLDRPLALQEWTTVRAQVQDLAPTANAITDGGNQGSQDEPDRVDIAFLPCDVDQNGIVQPLDLLRFRQIYAGTFSHPKGTAADYIDMDRNGQLAPIDLLRFRQLYAGSGASTRAWNGATLNHPRP